MSSSECHGCNEYLHLSRRQFMLSTSGAALAASLPAWLPRVAYAQDFCSNRDIIVAVYLRGACDALTMCVPFTETAYYQARPTLAIPQPDSGSPHAAIDLDGFFGFPQMLAPLMPAFQAGHLAVVHACGVNNSSRSHFDVQRFMEVGKPADVSITSGWLARHLASAPPLQANSILRGVSVGFGLQQSMVAAPETIAIPDMFTFGLGGDPLSLAERTAALGSMYAQVPNPLQSAATTTQATINLLNTIDFANYQPAGGAVYPTSTFGHSMKSTAALIKADVGVEAVAVDINGWDTHGAQGSIGGYLSDMLSNLAAGLAAFHADAFAGNGRNITVVVMTEFGRRLLENGSFGTDHGHGGAMMLMGNSINGGQVITQWPGLQPQNLFEERDLAITIDFRDVLAEIVQRRLGNPNLSYVFPDYTPTFRNVTTTCGLGDMNCDGQVNVNDVPGFVAALTDTAAFQAGSPGCNVTNADMNRDARMDGADIRAFTNKILNP
jgi:uncharacterized protein (DUF1501 family)